MTGNAPTMMLLPDKNVYLAKFVDGQYVISRYRLSDNVFRELTTNLNKINRKIEPYYVFDLGYDNADVTVYFRSNYGSQTTYIYPYATEVEEVRQGYLGIYQEKLKERAGEALVKVLEDAAILRKYSNEKYDMWNNIVFYYWKNKLPKIRIEEIRDRTTDSGLIWFFQFYLFPGYEFASYAGLKEDTRV